MRLKFNLFLLLFVLLGLSTAQAQLRSQVPASGGVPVKLFGDGAQGLFQRLFQPGVFQMRHSYELSYGMMGRSGLMTGMYTNTMLWQFSPKLAARVDVGLMFTPMASGLFKQQFNEGMQGRLFLRNAEIAYRPSENMQFHISFQQQPYHPWMMPYGRGMDRW